MVVVIPYDRMLPGRLAAQRAVLFLSWTGDSSTTTSSGYGCLPALATWLVSLTGCRGGKWRGGGVVEWWSGGLWVLVM